MKRTAYLFLTLCLILLIGCRITQRIPEAPGADIMTPMPSSIPPATFQSDVLKILTGSPINLTIDSVFNKTVSAYEIYDGRIHRKWFFWKTVWKEKTKYVLTYDTAGEGIVYTLRTATYEAPDVYWENWFKVEPSVTTKVNSILDKLK